MLNSVHPKAKYQKVRLVRLVGMMLIVLVQEKHLAYVRNVAVDTVGTGIMNKMVRVGCEEMKNDLVTVFVSLKGVVLAVIIYVV